MSIAKKSDDGEEYLSFLQFVRHTRSIQKKGHCEMARRERYTGDTERLIENSQRCSVTKDETCNNRGICSFFSSCSFTTNCLAPNGWIGCKCACPPSLSPSLPPREPSRLPTGPDLAIATRCNPHRRRCR